MKALDPARPGRVQLHGQWRCSRDSTMGFRRPICAKFVKVGSRALAPRLWGQAVYTKVMPVLVVASYLDKPERLSVVLPSGIVYTFRSSLHGRSERQHPSARVAGDGFNQELV